MIGRPRVHHREVGSTNALARELAGGGAPHGTLVTADHQSAGRGRSDRVWEAPPRSSVLLSVVIRPADPLLPLRAAVALCDVLADLPRVAIKWPNDVLVDGRKVAGILVEGRPQEGWAVLGMGVNVTAFPPELADRATCIVDAGGQATVDATLDALLYALRARITQAADELLAAWRERDALAGRPIAWEPDGSGTAVGVDDQGALLVDTPGGRVALDAGEVHLRG
jgi:BirA family biotin operon repressor/biotin-[acetyl-CoA-carboxylase] ligase